MSRNRTRNRSNSVSNTNQSGTSAESQTPTDSNEQTDEVDVNNEQAEQEQQAPMEVVADDLTGATQTPVEKEEAAEPEKAEETEVPQETPAPEETIQAVTTPPVEQTQVSEEEVLVDSTTVFPEDNANVAKLKEILKELKEALSAYGKTPEEFAAAAKLHSSLVRHVVNNARSEIFDVVLAFYEENIDGVCDPMEFMKGSTLMSSSEEQQLGYLNNLFYQLAKKRFVRVDQARIVNVLKRPEIFTYFKRRMDGIKANA